MDLLPIAQVERDTGLSKDTLRVWERRYGFPVPVRDGSGQRLYPADQLVQLRHIKRLMGQGFRPGSLVGKSVEELIGLSAGIPREESDLGLERPLTLLQSHRRDELHGMLLQRLTELGLRAFVLDLALPMTRSVGDLWFHGNIGVYEEHLWSELLSRVLRQALSNLPAEEGAPRLLLTTLPKERHGLGLMMVEVFASMSGARCISLGLGTPPDEIGRAARELEVAAVGLSFSSSYPGRALVPDIELARSEIPEAAELWVGGAALSGRRLSCKGVWVLTELGDVERQVRRLPTPSA